MARFNALYIFWIKSIHYYTLKRSWAKKYHIFYIFLHRAHNRHLLEAENKCFKSPNLTHHHHQKICHHLQKYQHQEYYLRKKKITFHFKIFITSLSSHTHTCVFVLFFLSNHTKWFLVSRKNLLFIIQQLKKLILLSHPFHFKILHVFRTQKLKKKNMKLPTYVPNSKEFFLLSNICFCDLNFLNSCKKY